MSDDKVMKITTLAPPTNVHGLREVLGLIIFYGGFISHYSDIYPSMNRLICKDVPWDWNAYCSTA
jgi:hypothetical protein